MFAQVGLMLFAPLGDVAVVVTLGETVDDSTLRQVRTLADALSCESGAGIIDVVPAYTTVTVFYEPAPSSDELPYDHVCRLIMNCAERLQHGGPKVSSPDLTNRRQRRHASRTVEIPVCYGGNFGPDLADVARHTGLSPAEVIKLHCSEAYLVCAIGFVPGFPYLGGLPERLHTPRRATPRTSVPIGSVGIGGEQTGIYSLPTPGGWQLIGRTPLQLFESGRDDPTLLHVGDTVSFRTISPEEFSAWK